MRGKPGLGRVEGLAAVFTGKRDEQRVLNPRTESRSVLYLDWREHSISASLSKVQTQLDDIAVLVWLAHPVVKGRKLHRFIHAVVDHDLGMQANRRTGVTPALSWSGDLGVLDLEFQFDFPSSTHPPLFQLDPQFDARQLTPRRFEDEVPARRDLLLTLTLTLTL